MKVIIASWYERDFESISSVMNPASIMATTASNAVIVSDDMLVAVKVTVHGRPEPQPMGAHMRKMLTPMALMAKRAAPCDAGSMAIASAAVGITAVTANIAGT